MRPGSIAAALLAAALAGPALAADGFRPVFGGSVTGGGETLVTVFYADGSTQKIRSGGLVHVFAGMEYDGDGFVVQANIGYHVDDTNARNGSVRFSRVPVELLGFWKATEQIRLGIGARKASGGELSSSGVATTVGGNLESTPGFVLQGELLFGAGLRGLLRFVAEDYKSNGQRISGNHVGLGMAFRF
jgi:opacity protein-like surface antigen